MASGEYSPSLIVKSTRTILWTDVIDADKDLRLLLHMPNTAIEQEIDSVLYQIFLIILLLNEIKSVHNLLR